MADTTMRTRIPLWIHMIFLVLTLAALVPPFLVARARYGKSPEPRVHPIPDMDRMPYYRPQTANAAFYDGRAMRLPVEGTVARGELREDDHAYRGKVAGAWAKEFPPSISVNMTLMRRGQERFGIYCSPCHGWDGQGKGMAAIRAKQVSEATWVDPTNLHNAGADGPASQPVGQLFNNITNGVRNMPPYAAQIPVEDRWAIVAYLRALQRSQNARLGDESGPR